MKVRYGLKVNKFQMCDVIYRRTMDEYKYIMKKQHWETNMLVVSRDIEQFELYQTRENEKKPIRYWLIENIIVKGTGKVGSGWNTVKLVPLYEVELIKQDKKNPDYWIVRLKNK